MPRIVRIVATEVVVPAQPGTINSPGIDQPLHKLPVPAGLLDGSVRRAAQCILELHLDDGIVGLGELYRDHDWRVVENIAKRFVGNSSTNFRASTCQSPTAASTTASNARFGTPSPSGTACR